jgi:hypothetical protein
MAESHDGTGGGLDLFLEWAGRTGEMNPATANSYRTAVGKVLAVEGEAIDQVDVTRFDPEAVLARWENLNRTNYSSGSLNTYKSRFRQAVAMYKAWLVQDPNWKQAGKGSSSNGTRPSVKTGRPRKPKAKANGDEPQQATEPASAQGPRMVAYDLPLRPPDLLVRLTLPMDLTKEDAARISAFVNSLAFSPSIGTAAVELTATSTLEGG